MNLLSVDTLILLVLGAQAAGTSPAAIGARIAQGLDRNAATEVERYLRNIARGLAHEIESR